jgi:phospho-N-acetylmuramoyl-pentapeptide-transferase
MFYELLYPLKDIFSFFNLFKYITFRSIGAALTAFILSLLLARILLPLLIRLKFKENVEKSDSAKLNELHQGKKGTPTMGGILIVTAVTLSTILWARWEIVYIKVALVSLFFYALIGFYDDWIKLTHAKRPGLSSKQKLALLTVVSLGVSLSLWSHYQKTGEPLSLTLPFAKDFVIDLSLYGGLLYLAFSTLVLVSTTNAVNLTDGLDGLATGSVIIAAMAFSIFCYVAGHLHFAQYLQIPYVAGAGELTVFCFALMGAGLGFLWFNCYPAQMFMGDTGSLALGGAIGFVAIAVRQEIALILIGGVFVLEALSVILQVFSFKVFKKRIFRIAPIHHHFQFAGLSETKVTIRFWILSSLFAICSLATLKIR